MSQSDDKVSNDRCLPEKDLVGDTFLSRVDLVTLALYLLNGSAKTVDTENVASKAHELQPGSFRWRTREDQINLELVRVALSDAKKAKSGWVEGSGKRGWSLTSDGQEYATRLESSYADSMNLPGDDSRGSGVGVEDSRRTIEKARLLSTAAWKKWKQGEQAVNKRDAEEVFRIDAYSTGRMRSIKLNRLLTLFKGQDEIQKFLNKMKRSLS